MLGEWQMRACMRDTWNDAVSPGALIAIARLLRLSKLFEILGCFWNYVLFKLHNHSAQRGATTIPSQTEVEVNLGIFLFDSQAGSGWVAVQLEQT